MNDKIYKKLNELYEEASKADCNHSFINDDILRSKIYDISTNKDNRAVVRLVLSCSFAPLINSKFDPLKPYTEIGGEEAFSGRNIDESYIQQIIDDKSIGKCNATTAFLTPALRNRNESLDRIAKFNGRPESLYKDAVYVLKEVSKNKEMAEDIIKEIFRILICLELKEKENIKAAISNLKGKSSYSSREIIDLIRQHLLCKRSSRLPVLVIAAAFKVIEDLKIYKVKEISMHNAADNQTENIGDVEVYSTSSNLLIAFEVKKRKINRHDVNVALEKIAKLKDIGIASYIFITTENIENDIINYVAELSIEYDIDLRVMDCLAFLEHYLTIFFDKRRGFLDKYQSLLIDEPESAVSHDLKEIFLSLRKIMEEG